MTQEHIYQERNNRRKEQEVTNNPWTSEVRDRISESEEPREDGSSPEESGLLNLKFLGVTVLLPLSSFSWEEELPTLVSASVPRLAAMVGDGGHPALTKERRNNSSCWRIESRNGEGKMQMSAFSSYLYIQERGD